MIRSAHVLWIVLVFGAACSSNGNGRAAVDALVFDAVAYPPVSMDANSSDVTVGDITAPRTPVADVGQTADAAQTDNNWDAESQQPPVISDTQSSSSLDTQVTDIAKPPLDGSGTAGTADTTGTSVSNDTQGQEPVAQDVSAAEISQQVDASNPEADANNSGAPAAGTAITLTGTGLPASLPANGTTGSLQSFSSPAPSGKVIDVDLTLSLQHKCTKDLSASLVSPSGTSVVLFDLSSYPVCSSDMTNTHFDDDSVQSIKSAFKPFTGAFKPLGTLADFDGEDAAGVWVLELYDDTIGDAGKLKSWSVELVIE